MNEEEPIEESPSVSTGTSDDVDAVAAANAAADRLERANAELSKLLLKQQTMKVEKTLAGSAYAGSKPVDPEEIKNAQARKMLEGSGFEHMFDAPK